MKNKVITVLSVLAFIGGFLIFYQTRFVTQKTPNTTETNKETSSAQKWETKTDEQANVTVVVTPLDLSPQSTEWKFDVGMNTHSVELNQDMTKVVILVDDQEKEYKPIRWDGQVGGHHREGVLIFNTITPIPKSVGLKIYDVGGVSRSFNWQFK